MNENENENEPLERLQDELRSRLSAATTANPGARLTKRGRLIVAGTVIAVIATPAGAIALQGEENDPEDVLVPAPAPLCIDNPDLAVCDDRGTIPPSPKGTPEEFQPSTSPVRPEENEPAP